MWLQTAAGTWVQITAIDDAHRGQRVHNLTVEGQHTYFVLAGVSPLLVHNDGKKQQPEACPIDLGQVNFPKHPSKKAAATNGQDFTLSGDAADFPSGFVRPTRDQVLAVQQSIGKGLQSVPMKFLDNGEHPSRAQACDR
ncbi:hypothetical protein [Streptomyces sp. KR55]|uniref:hypothetical protein n=1 Tax=Streptomyces sp. KR55 TaxID=3457425 RepID=UPI003FD0FD3C